MRLEKQVERRNCESPGSPWILDHPDHVDSRSALPSEHRSQTAAAASTPAVRGITLPAGPASSIRQPGMMPEEAPISAQAISTCSLEDASAWEEHVRRCASTMQGPVCVLDINDVNVSDFCQGDFQFLVDDLNTVFPSEIADSVLEAWVVAGVKDAFHVRREMVNFKKVCLNVYQDADKLEKDMRQMCSFFHPKQVSDAEVSEEGDYHILSERYTELCQALMQCKGGIAVVSDTRKFTKSLCCVPRFPNKPVPSALAGVPMCMKVWRDLQRARDFLHGGVKGWQHLLKERANIESHQEQMEEEQGGKDGCCGFENTKRGDNGDSADANAAQISDAEQMDGNVRHPQHMEGGNRYGGREEEQVNSREQQKQGDAVKAEERRSNDAFARLVGEMEGWGYPSHVIHFLKLVLISRGAAKALWIAQEAKILHKALETVKDELSATVRELQQLPGTQPIILELKACTSAKEAIRRRKREELMEALYGQRHLKILSGSTALLADVVRWMGAIANSDVTCRRLFLAGDLDRQHGATMFTPEGFQMIPVFESFRAVYSKYRPDLDNAIKEEGWPPPAGSHRSRMLHGESKCRICQAKCASLWVHRGVCFVCEEAEAAAGRCPHRAACSPSSFCPHLRACLSCTGGSCEECGFLFGDGEDVQCLVKRLEPVAVYLDFDRTLCTTKGGGSPLVGNHSLDPGLASVLAVYANKAVVVTRNSFRDDIRKFMAEKGMGSVNIYTTKKHQSKADAMREPETLGPGECIVFVDDSVAELIDPRLTGKYGPGQLKRVLFSRARI